MEKLEVKEVCKKHMYRYVRATMADGSTHDGFIENVDDENLYLAMPVGHENIAHHQANAQFHHANAPYHPEHVSPYHHGCCWDPCYRYPELDARAFFPYGGFGPGFGPGFGFPYGRRRFNRLALPLVGLTALSLLPFF